MRQIVNATKWNKGLRIFCVYFFVLSLSLLFVFQGMSPYNPFPKFSIANLFLF